MNARRGVLSAVAIASLLGAFLLAPSAPAVAGASPGPGFDRQISQPTGWWAYTGLTTSQVGAKLKANHARLTDLEVRTTKPLTFSVTMVSNAGVFDIASWWSGNLSKAKLVQAFSANTFRPISVQRYTDATGHPAYAVVAVGNTGVNKTPWWLVQGSHASISAALTKHHARLVQLTSYSSTGYTALLVANTGPQRVSSWVAWHESTSAINAAVDKHDARIVDISRNGDGTYNAILYANTAGTTWYWRVGEPSIQALVAEANQLGQRIFDIARYTVGGTVFYAGVMTDDLNALSRKLANTMAAVVHTGRYGFFFRKVNGAVLANLEDDLPYEPASALKVLYHLRTIESEAAGTAHDSTKITYHYDPSDPTNSGICPDDFSSTKTTNLANADSLMMENSDNRMTRGILTHFSKPAMLSLAKSLHMTSTAIHHNIGCPTATTHNQTTLDDLDQIYNGFASGHLVTNPTWRTAFTDRMLNESYSPFKSLICPIVSKEAAKLGKSTTVASQFCEDIHWYAKGGSYQYAGGWPANISYDGMSVTRLPFVKRGDLVPVLHDYVYGYFEDEVTIHSDSQQKAVSGLDDKLYAALITPQIDAALKTWS